MLTVGVEAPRAVSGARGVDDPPLVVKQPREQRAAEQEHFVRIGKAKAPFLVVPRRKRRRACTIEKPLSSANENHAGFRRFLRIPPRTKAVQLNRPRLPHHAVAAAPFPMRMFPRDPLRAESHEQISACVLRIAAPEKHLLHEHSREIADQRAHLRTRRRKRGSRECRCGNHGVWCIGVLWCYSVLLFLVAELLRRWRFMPLARSPHSVRVKPLGALQP